MRRIESDESVQVRLEINGRSVEGSASSRTLLSDFVRHELGQTGTHVGCEHGVCGACTVLIDGDIARACLTLAVQAEGSTVETVEGLADAPGKLGVLQEAFVEHHGLQCGFCTPGILMSLSTLLQREPHADEERIREVLSGHLCRCTGYVSIMQAALAAQKRLNESD